MGEINWNTELKKIEREFLGLPPTPTAEELRARRDADRKARDARRQRQTALGASIHLALVVLLAVAINFWPYAHACGFGLFAYLGAETLLVLGGLWTIVYTWRGRMPRAHALAMLVVLWGLALIAAQVLPRVGYARTPSGAPAVWVCSDAGP